MDMERTVTELHVRREGSVDWLTLSSGDGLNTFDVGNAIGLRDYFRQLADDEECRCVVLSGAGQNFSAGLNLKAAQHLPEAPSAEVHALMNRFGEVTLAMRMCPQPIVALVRGHAIGGGFAYACAADLRIAAEDASFSTGFIKLGLSGSELGVGFLLPRLIGSARAAELMLTGRPLRASEAIAWGLVSRVVPADDLVAAAQELVEEMLRSSWLGLRLTKESINLGMMSGGLEAMLSAENRAQTLTMPHAREGMNAFMERRTPKFDR